LGGEVAKRIGSALVGGSRVEKGEEDGQKGSREAFIYCCDKVVVNAALLWPFAYNTL
jgi:hypothetical protein